MRPKGSAGGNATETLYLLHIYLRMRVVSAGLAFGGDLPETHRDVASMLLRNVDIGVGLNTVEEDYEGESIKKASILFILSISAFIDELKSAAVVRIIPDTSSACAQTFPHSSPIGSTAIFGD